MEWEWKSRYCKHKLSFKRKRYANMTTLSSYMWHLKSVSSETPNLKWSALRCVPQYSNTSKKCLMCFYEKLEIVTVLIKTRRNSWTRDLNSTVNVAISTSFLLKNYTGNDYREFTILGNRKKHNCEYSNILFYVRAEIEYNCLMIMKTLNSELQ